MNLCSNVVKLLMDLSIYIDLGDRIAFVRIGQMKNSFKFISGEGASDVSIKYLINLLSNNSIAPNERTFTTLWVVINNEDLESLRNYVKSNQTIDELNGELSN